jgi:hypothetical protein
MNFSKAVKGHPTKSFAIKAIQSQAETELGRKLTKEEESILFPKPIQTSFWIRLRR